jgi:hypothetical protein
MITQIIYKILPQAYQTSVALIKRDLCRRVPFTLFDVYEDICQIYGLLQQPFGRQNITPSNKTLSIKMTPYLPLSLGGLNSSIASVVRWVTKELTIGFIQIIKISLVHPVFKNSMINLDHLIVPTSVHPTNIHQIKLLLSNLHAPTVINPIILKLTAIRNKQIFAIKQITKQIQMKEQMLSLLQHLWN